MVSMMASLNDIARGLILSLLIVYLTIARNNVDEHFKSQERPLACFTCLSNNVSLTLTHRIPNPSPPTNNK